MPANRNLRKIDNTGRRAFLTAVGTVTLGGLAGCSSNGGGDEDEDESGTATDDEQLSGLRLAHRADAGVTTDSEGRVETWADQSGNGNDFSIESGEQRPTVTADAVNGKPVVTLDGENDYFVREDTLGIANDSPRTFVAVTRLAETTPRCPFVTQGKRGSNEQLYGMEANTFRTAGERSGSTSSARRTIRSDRPTRTTTSTPCVPRRSPT